MTKFEIPPCPSKIRYGKSPQVSFRLDEDLVEPFRKRYSESGLSLNVFTNAMIRHCLEDLGDVPAGNVKP